MTCPDCGYMMTAFDKKCPRCAALRRSQRACLKCGTAYLASAQECPRCHHGNGQPILDRRPEASKPASPASVLGVPFAQSVLSSSSQASVPQAPAAGTPSSHAASILPADYLMCRVCGNSGVQKVSAICQAGTWSGQSQGQTFGMAYGPNGPIPVAGQTTAATSGATTLAQLLMPPVRPTYAMKGFAPALGAVMGALGLIFAILCMIGGGAEGTVVWLLVFGGGVAMFLGSSSTDWKNKARVAAQLPHWEKAMVVWNRLFYCPRCAHVFDPADGAFGTVHEMHRLIQPKVAILSEASQP